MKKILLQLSDKCENVLMELMAWNGEIVFEKVPENLAKLPLFVALFVWLLFSVFWIVVAGAVTLVVESALFLFVAIGEILATNEKLALWKIIAGLVAMSAVMLVCYFLPLRFIGVASAFADGIWRPRASKCACAV